MMHMTFYWSKDLTLLFPTWHTSSYFSYSLSLLACLLFSAFYQYLENLRLRPSASEHPLLILSSKKPLSARVAQALLFGINSAIGYLLMLAVMSFNGGVFVAVVLGLSVGFLLFRSEEEGSVHLENACGCA